MISTESSSYSGSEAVSYALKQHELLDPKVAIENADHTGIKSMRIARKL